MNKYSVRAVAYPRRTLLNILVSREKLMRAFSAELQATFDEMLAADFSVSVRDLKGFGLLFIGEKHVEDEADPSVEAGSQEGGVPSPTSFAQFISQMTEQLPQRKLLTRVTAMWLGDPPMQPSKADPQKLYDLLRTNLQQTLAPELEKLISYVRESRDDHKKSCQNEDCDKDAVYVAMETQLQRLISDRLQ